MIYINLAFSSFNRDYWKCHLIHG